MLANFKKYKTGIIAIFLMIFTFPLFSVSVWEGSAAMGEYGEFPFTGYYGASNSFVQNSYVEVENLENGKKIRLIIVDRLADDGLLMLLSNEASASLGISEEDIAKIRVELISVESSAKAPVYDDIAVNPDPDINASASLLTSKDFVPAKEPETKEAMPVEPESQKEPEIEPQKIADAPKEATPEKKEEEPIIEPEPKDEVEPEVEPEPEVK